MNRGFCIKCKKLYTNVAKCTLHPDTPLLSINTRDDYYYIRHLIFWRALHGSRIAYWLFSLLILSFYISLCIQGEVHILAFHKWKGFVDMLVSNPSFSLILYSFLTLVNLPFILYICYIICFPIVYVFLFAPAIFLGKAFYQIFTNTPYIPVATDHFGAFVKQYLKILSSVVAPFFCMRLYEPSDDMFPQSYSDSHMKTDFDDLGRKLDEETAFFMESYYRASDFIDKVCHKLWLFCGYQPKTALGKFLISIFYPMRLHWRFHQRYSWKSAKEKIEMFLQKVGVE